MDHLRIAFQVLILLAGSASLSFLVYWSVRIRRTYLYLFTVFYSLFTLSLIITLVREYALLFGLPHASTAAYFLYGASTTTSFAVLAAAVCCIHAVTLVNRRAFKNTVAVCAAGIGAVLVLLPISTVFDPSNGTVVLKSPFLIASGIYLAVFTYAIAAGLYGLRRIHDRKMKRFAIGLLAFAAFGYAESIAGAVGSFLYARLELRGPDDGWSISSIPYAVYGIFLIFHFARHEESGARGDGSLSREFVVRFGLSPREVEVVTCVLKGYSNEKIAGELFISRGTVKAHLHTIFRKTGAGGRFELIRKATRP